MSNFWNKNKRYARKSLETTVSVPMLLVGLCVSSAAAAGESSREYLDCYWALQDKIGYLGSVSASRHMGEDGGDFIGLVDENKRNAPSRYLLIPFRPANTGFYLFTREGFITQKLPQKPSVFLDKGRRGRLTNTGLDPFVVPAAATGKPLYLQAIREVPSNAPGTTRGLRLRISSDAKFPGKMTGAFAPVSKFAVSDWEAQREFERIIKLWLYSDTGPVFIFKRLSNQEKRKNIPKKPRFIDYYGALNTCAKIPSLESVVKNVTAELQLFEPEPSPQGGALVTPDRMKTGEVNQGD